MSETTFAHQRLDFYRLAISYFAFSFRFAQTLLEVHRQSLAQWSRAVQSIPLNIAEGNGKQSLRDKNRCFEIARSSILECAAIRDVLKVCGAIDEESSQCGKSDLKRIVSMLPCLIQKTDAISEERSEYEYEYEQE